MTAATADSHVRLWRSWRKLRDALRDECLPSLTALLEDDPKDAMWLRHKAQLIPMIEEAQRQLGGTG